MSDGPSAGGRYGEDWSRPASKPAAPTDGEMLTFLCDYITQHGADGLKELLWTVVEEDEGDALMEDRADLVFDRAAIAAAMKKPLPLPPK